MLKNNPYREAKDFLLFIMSEKEKQFILKMEKIGCLDHPEYEKFIKKIIKLGDLYSE